MKKGTVTMLKKKYYDGFTVHDILNKHLDDGHKILELLTAFADADGVDAMPVIRCKDCKFSKAYYHGSESNLGMFTYLCTQGLYGMNEDDYCSRAERKEE